MSDSKELSTGNNILEFNNRLEMFFSAGNIFLNNILILKNNFVNDISCFLLKKNNNVSIFLKKNVFNIIFYLKNSSYFSFSQLLDFTVVDRLEMSIKKDKRFEFFYLFVSTLFSYRVFLRGFISSFESIKSLSVLYNSSVWLEREVWDMFGIFIVEHPDLRRILTDYGFLGHPFRKDFPLSGYVELRYDETNKYIVAEPLELSQEFRFFKFDNPWKK
jgi:NADH:ubiquinone oxidoreductase subunit C